MELYPGPINTAVVELNERVDNDLSVHPGAIVAGLGDVGELTPGSSRRRWRMRSRFTAADCVGRVRRWQQREGFVPPTTISAPVTAILTGSGEGGSVARRQHAGAADGGHAGQPAAARSAGWWGRSASKR